MLRQILQVEHLSQRHPPVRQTPMVQDELHIGVRAHNRRPLEARRIPRDGRELVLPQPAHRRLARFHADEVVDLTLGNFGFVGAEGFVGRTVPAANKEDVPGPEGDVLFGRDFLKRLKWDRLGLEVVDLDAVLFGVIGVIEENAAASYAGRARLEPS